jgi:hypothetical protein
MRERPTQQVWTPLDGGCFPKRRVVPDLRSEGYVYRAQLLV